MSSHEELLQERIQILLDRLQWSYITLWILDPRTRMLEWKRGHFQVAREREYALLLYSKYRTCCFTPGIGAVGRANLEGKTIWLTGASVCQQAGSLEHSQFLRGAEIKTMMCIPWVDSVLEIGTVNVVAESLVLTDRIQQVLAKDLLAIAEPEPEPAITSMFQESNVPRVDHPTNLALQPPSSITLGGARGHLPLAEQQWRSASSLRLGLSSDIFSPEPESSREQDRAFERSCEAAEPSSSLRMQQAAQGGIISFEMNVNSQSHGLMTDRYSTGPALWPGPVANSSSTATSSREDSSARTSVPPELQQDAHAHSFANPRFSADDSQLAGPRNLIRRANSCGEYEIQRDVTLFEAQELHQQWRQQDPAVGQTLPFQANWRREVATSQPKTTISGDQPGSMRQSTRTAKRSNVELMNQVSKIAGPLLRRQSLSALELLKGADTLYQKGAAAAEASVPSENKPVQVLQEVNPSLFEIDRPSRRSMGEELAGSTGPVHAGHNEAAVSHKLAERRRRTKQTENFSVLRKLVPIISKGDKVSTLVDTISYLKFLQNKVQDIEANKEDIDQRCQALENKCKGLRDRNLELVEILSNDLPSGSGAIHLNLVHLKLQSNMNSS